MATDIPGVRPAVLSAELKQLLDKFRGFRHFVRNAYTFTFVPSELEKLLDKLDMAISSARLELGAFAALLEQRANESE